MNIKKHLFIMSFIMIIVGCSEENKLFIYNWSDYLSPEIIQQFENENNCKVIVDSFDSNEQMFTKITNSGNMIGYDLIFPSSYQVEQLKDMNLLEIIDYSLLNNFTDNYDIRYDRILIDTNKTYSVPYSASFAGLAYKTNKIHEITSWNDIETINVDRRICLLDDMRQTMGAALLTLGYSINSSNINEITEAGEMVKRWKNNIKKLDNDCYKNGLISDEFYIVHGYNNDIAMLVKYDDSIRFVLPKEGYVTTCDEISIIKNANNKDMAYKFINFLYRPNICAKNMDYIRGSMPSVKAEEYVSEEIRGNPLIFPSDEYFTNAAVLKNVGEDIEVYYSVWNKIR